MINFHKSIDTYYSNKIREYGATPKGVDWNGEDGQLIRFHQLSKIIKKTDFSINDLGCGYGAYFEYLNNFNFGKFIYKGYDLSKEMVDQANKIYRKENAGNSIFMRINSLEELVRSDYTVASGIFNVRMDFPEVEWFSYIMDSIEKINEKSKKGFSFNMLTKYSDKELKKNNLYYADPLFFFDYCKNNYSKEVSLLHDYDLYEFTILVRKV